jgi:hypothetical protein
MTPRPRGEPPQRERVRRPLPRPRGTLAPQPGICRQQPDAPRTGETASATETLNPGPAPRRPR